MYAHYYCLVFFKKKCPYILNLRVSNMPKNVRNKSTKIHRDEVKRNKLLENKRSKIISIILNITNAIRHNPTLWTTSKLFTLRDFTYEVANKPSIYPPPIDQETYKVTTCDLSLTPNFVISVYNRTVSSRHNIQKYLIL